MNSNEKKTGPRQGNVVVWPKGVEERYGISAPTRWRWEKSGLLPPRDIKVGMVAGVAGSPCCGVAPLVLLMLGISGA